jgi:hypothetical protein
LNSLIQTFVKNLNLNKNSSTIIKRQKRSNQRIESLFFEQQTDRFIATAPNPITDDHLKFVCALKEKFGDTVTAMVLHVDTTNKQISPKNVVNSNVPSDQNIQLIINVSEHLIRNIFKYNKEFINHSLNHMLKLDDKLTNKLLVNLWHNDMCEKYVQVKCNSLLNPMHQCSRPAMVKFVYELATKRDHYKQEIKENRRNYDRILSNFMDASNVNTESNNSEVKHFPHSDIVSSMVAMNQLIKRLLRNHHIYQQTLTTTTNQYYLNNSDYNNQFLLTRIFYMLIDLYESYMNHPNDVLNDSNPISSSARRKLLNEDCDQSEQQSPLSEWSLLQQQINTNSETVISKPSNHDQNDNNNNDDPNNQDDSSSFDSIHLYMFDLINLIGVNFIQISSSSEETLRSLKLTKNTNQDHIAPLQIRNQQVLLEKIIEKLVNFVQLSALTDQPKANNELTQTTSNTTAATTSNNNNTTNSSQQRRANNILLNSARNKLALMSLCAQYVEPNDLDLFNESYMNILCSITSVLLNDEDLLNTYSNINIKKSQNLPSNSSYQASPSLVCVVNDIIIQKYSIINKLLSKFSFKSLNRLIILHNESIKQNGDANSDQNEKVISICSQFVDSNINFLLDAKLNSDSFRSSTNEKNVKQQHHHLKLLFEQCIDNFLSILNVNYPFYFEFMLKKCLQFSSNQAALKFGTSHLTRFQTILQQQELLLQQQQNLLTIEQFEGTFQFLYDFFNFEQNKYKTDESQMRITTNTHSSTTFYSHWSLYARSLSDIFNLLFVTYFNRFCVKKLTDFQKKNPSKNDFNKFFDTFFEEVWSKLVDLYIIWIEPSSIKPVASKGHIKVREIYEKEIAAVHRSQSQSETTTITPDMAVLIMFSSFLQTFHTIIETIKGFYSHTDLGKGAREQALDYQTILNSMLNKFLLFYYETLACSLTSASSINDNTLECYHQCISKYSTTWFGNGSFEPDYRSINILSELCSSTNTNILKYLAYDLVALLDFNRITESYFRQNSILPVQINDLLKTCLQLLCEFCLRDSIRESNQFDAIMRPIYNQIEMLQCWSMLSDTNYSDVIMNRFCSGADYQYAFASRGTERGLLVNILKSAAEFYSFNIDTASGQPMKTASCFSSAKRRCFLRALCLLLLKPSTDIIQANYESFQNCIMNLLTDIETFSLSASTNEAVPGGEANKGELKHEIQLLIDEALCLITVDGGQMATNQEPQFIYSEIIRMWISSSRDSPILLHFINRLSRNYKLLIENDVNNSSSEKYCQFVELCLDVFFETDRQRTITPTNGNSSSLVISDQIESGE